MTSPTKLAHVVLFTSRLAEMRDWYLNVLDARVVHENPAAVFMTYDEEHHRIALADRDAVARTSGGLDRLVAPSGDGVSREDAAPQNRGLSHIAFTYDSLAALLENFERLEKQRITPVFSVNHGTTTSLYYTDPDGNNIELQVDNFETIEEGTAYMESEAFEKNPVGIPVDPQSLLARLRTGEPAATLIRPWW